MKSTVHRTLRRHPSSSRAHSRRKWNKHRLIWCGSQQTDWLNKATRVGNRIQPVFFCEGVWFVEETSKHVDFCNCCCCCCCAASAYLSSNRTVPAPRPGCQCWREPLLRKTCWRIVRSALDPAFIGFWKHYSQQSFYRRQKLQRDESLSPSVQLQSAQ